MMQGFTTFLLFLVMTNAFSLGTCVIAQSASQDSREASDSFNETVKKTTGDNPDEAASWADLQLNRIVFGSCIKQDQPMPIFRQMLSHQPDLALLIGDNIYGDTADMTVMREKYAKLRGNTDFAAFEAQVPLLATWDDHDFGMNDAGADFSQRSASQEEFLRFWGIPTSSPRWNRPGVYDSKLIGPKGQQVQVILLDTRYFRSPLRKGAQRRVAGPYVPDVDTTKTMLGEVQWAWLEEQLRVPAELRLMVTSIQCIPEAAGQETWSNLPAERTRLLELFESMKVEGVVLLSGDRHWAELSVYQNRTGYPIYEFTSSSLNQKHPRGTPSRNRFRADSKTFHQENFGLIEIEWEGNDPGITLQLRDKDNLVQLQKTLRFGELRWDDQGRP